MHRIQHNPVPGKMRDGTGEYRAYYPPVIKVIAIGYRFRFFLFFIIHVYNPW